MLRACRVVTVPPSSAMRSWMWRLARKVMKWLPQMAIWSRKEMMPMVATMRTLSAGRVNTGDAR